MTGYPWSTGDQLFANDLNAAIALSAPPTGTNYLPTNGALPMTGPLTLAGNATLPLHAVPLQQVNAVLAGGNPGAFSTLSASGTVSGPGFTSLLSPYMPLAGGAMTGQLVANANSTNPQATAQTAFFTGQGNYSVGPGSPQWFPTTSLWLPNGDLLVSNPEPYGAAGLAITEFATIGMTPGAIPQCSGGVVVSPSQLATYPSRDAAVFLTQAASIGPLLVLNPVTYDTTHVYPGTALTAGQVASIKPNMVIDTNHTPKLSGLVTAVTTTSITVSGWYQTVGAYASAATVVVGGSGYQVGDVCQVESLPTAACATVTVITVSGGAITGLAVSYGGSYPTQPQNPVTGYPLTGGHGTGATIGLTMTAVSANTAAGQNPQSVALHGTAPPALTVYVNPMTKTWNRDSIAQVGGGGGVNPWSLPWVSGGGITAATGEEMDLVNNTGVYFPGNDGMDGDFPQIRGYEISNAGSGRISIGAATYGDFQNGFVTYGQFSGTTAFGAYSAGIGWTVRADPVGGIELGAQRGGSTSIPGFIRFMASGSSQADATLAAASGTAGTPGTGWLSAAAIGFYTQPGNGANNLQIRGALAGHAPAIAVGGTDTNISLQLYTQGTGTIQLMAPLTPGTGGGAIDGFAIGNTTPANATFLQLIVNGDFYAGGNAASNVPAAYNGGAITWNYQAGNGEMDYWCLYSTPPGAAHTFWQRTSAGAATRLLDIGPTGAVTAYGSVTVGGAGQCTITSGAAAPAATQPAGSIYMRTGGASGARFYVSAGAGTWTAVAGV